MKQIISKAAPAAIGPYCHAVIHENLMFCSGQIPLDPDTMEIAGQTIEEQTARVMKNLEAVLSDQGIGLDKILKTTIFLSDMENFVAMNNVYESALDGHKPARSTVEVSRLPKDVLVEIECIAALS